MTPESLYRAIGTHALIALIGAIASAINAVAGGGSLISFPFLSVGLGMPAVRANVTNTVSLWTGSLAGGFGFKEHFSKIGPYLRRLTIPTLVGSLCGAWILLHTKKAVFDIIVPILILLATVCLLFQPQIKAFAASRKANDNTFGGIVIQFLVSVYGGYFGAGMGLMMLGAFALTMDEPIHEMNAIKNLLGTVINLVAAIYFISQGVVDLPVAGTLMVGSVVGGYVGARFSQRFAADKLRIAIVVYGFAMAAYFGYRAFVH